MKYIAFYDSYFEPMEGLSFEQIGKLVVALHDYKETGSIPDIDAETNMAFRFMKAQMDRDAAAYDEKCEKNRDNIKKRWNKTDTNDTSVYDGKRTYTNGTKEKEKEKEKENINPLTPLEGEPPELVEAVGEWLLYKKEKRQAYKATGLRSFLSQVKKNARDYGAETVARVIRDSMASNYQGVVWDWLKNGDRGAPPGTSEEYDWIT